MLGKSIEPGIWKVDDRVAHYREPSMTGTIRIVEDNQLSMMVQWDGFPNGELDFQWSNKLVAI